MGDALAGGMAVSGNVRYGYIPPDRPGPRERHPVRRFLLVIGACTGGRVRDRVETGPVTAALLAERPPVVACPLLDLGPLPHLAHVKYDLRLGEVGPGDQLLHALPAETAEHAADLRRAHEVMHGSNHSQDATCHLTSGQALGQASHVTTRERRKRHRLDGAPCYHFYYHQLSCENFDALDARAGGHCELCGVAEEETPRGYLVIDHFDAGRFSFVRGLVCDACNAVMSCFDGNKAWGANRRWEQRAGEYERNSWQKPCEEAFALMAARTELYPCYDPRYVPLFSKPRLRLEPIPPPATVTIPIPLGRGQKVIAQKLRRHLSRTQIARLVDLLAQED